MPFLKNEFSKIFENFFTMLKFIKINQINDKTNIMIKRRIKIQSSRPKFNENSIENNTN